MFAAMLALELRDPASVRTYTAELRAALGAGGAETEAELLEALAVARRQGARLFELRAAASLIRHRLAGGDGSAVEEARAWLAGVLAALPEGGDTADRREAAALLGRG